MKHPGIYNPAQSLDFVCTREMFGNFSTIANPAGVGDIGSLSVDRDLAADTV